MEILKRYYRKIRSRLKKFAIRNFGHTDYKKFVIISRSRTGSTLLMAFLRSHPNVHIEGEIFKKLNGKSCRTIWNELFSNKPRAIKRVGFKLFYYHPFDADKEVWDFLLNDKEVAVLHLRRVNLLRAFASQKIGEKTKKWTQHISDSANQDKRIELDAEECLETFETITSYEDNARAQFKDHNVYVECTYEELASDNQKLMSEIFKELNLKDHKASSVLKKQNPEPLSKLIVNYDSLEKRFRDTKWNYLFAESN